MADATIPSLWTFGVGATAGEPENMMIDTAPEPASEPLVSIPTGPKGVRPEWLASERAGLAPTCDSVRHALTIMAQRDGHQVPHLSDSDIYHLLPDDHPIPTELIEFAAPRPPGTTAIDSPTTSTSTCTTEVEMVESASAGERVSPALPARSVPDADVDAEVIELTRSPTLPAGGASDDDVEGIELARWTSFNASVRLYTADPTSRVPQAASPFDSVIRVPYKARSTEESEKTNELEAILHTLQRLQSPSASPFPLFISHDLAAFRFRGNIVQPGDLIKVTPTNRVPGKAHPGGKVYALTLIPLHPLPSAPGSRAVKRGGKANFETNRLPESIGPYLDPDLRPTHRTSVGVGPAPITQTRRLTHDDSSAARRAERTERAERMAAAVPARGPLRLPFPGLCRSVARPGPPLPPPAPAPPSEEAPAPAPPSEERFRRTREDGVQDVAIRALQSAPRAPRYLGTLSDPIVID